MFTFCIIVFIIILIIARYQDDKKSNKELARIEYQTQQLPDLYFCMHQMTSTQKVLNLWPSDNDILQSFKYEANTRVITLTMKDGRSITCPLSELFVDFDKVQSMYRFEVKYGGSKFSFYQYAYIYTDKEWDIIISVLTLAGHTRNVSIMGSTYKNLSRASTILKIIKAIS